MSRDLDLPPFERTSPHRSLWLQHALSDGDEAKPEPLRGSIRSDVCVVGGGLTGLWTAIALRAREPSIDVVLVEADLCGSGASGRSGGFVMTWWSKILSLLKLCGPEDALRMAQRAERSVLEIGRFCDSHQIEAGFQHGGWIWTATNRSQIDAWAETIKVTAALGAEPFQYLDRAELARRTGSPAHLAGVIEPSAAVVQPALLSRGLTSVARDMGVRIYEHSPAVRVHAEPRPTVVTTGGDVAADSVILALNAWGASIPQLRRALVVVSSDIIATDPIPERLAEIGLTKAVAISDSRRLVNYYRTSGDGRVIFGKGGGTLARGGLVNYSFDRPSPRVEEIRVQLGHLYPSLWDAPLATSWRGPIDYSITGLPFFSRVHPRANVFAAAGFSGNGVGPSHFAGEILANLAINGRDESLPAALTQSPSGWLPREPIRYLGGRLVRAAVARKESAEDRDRRPPIMARALASLDPTSFVDRGSSTATMPRSSPLAQPGARTSPSNSNMPAAHKERTDAAASTK